MESPLVERPLVERLPGAALAKGAGHATLAVGAAFEMSINKTSINIKFANTSV